MRKILVFDTTLRDGEQSPGSSLNIKQKLEVARALERLHVDVIEAGFPVASPGDFEAVKAIAEEITGPTICGLARCHPKDIEAAGKALKGAAHPRIHVFLATSEIHRKFKLNKAKSEILKQAVEGVKMALAWVKDVEFSPEDASRTEPDFLTEVVSAIIRAGARTVNIPDTVGYALPGPYGNLIRHLRTTVPNIDKAIISVHCHNDLGMAVANSLSAIEAGAGQVEVTINGIGERAGNAALEEVVMALKTRADHFDASTGVATKRIMATSRLVANLTGTLVQRNKAVVGENAFAHESGIHQDGMLKERSTYEIMRPSDVGLKKSRLVLGKHSGRHALGHRLRELGYTIAPDKLDPVFARFKDLADKKKEVFDEDLVSIVEDETTEIPRVYELLSFHISSGTQTTPTATVKLKLADGRTMQDAGCGDGPVDAIYRTVERITGIKIRLLDYNLRAVTGGEDAVGEVNLLVRHKGMDFRGRAASTDIVEASAKALINVLNRIAYRAKRRGSRMAKGRTAVVSP
ncbi:MAG: 2-isopropylmalate synthase [Planctomycetota bacterium]